MEKIIGFFTQKNSCLNFKHGSPNAPERFCPTCGESVNENIPIAKCSEENHEESRRNMHRYCVVCGEQLFHGNKAELG